MGRVKRTSINLDLDLTERAREALGTGTNTETLHRALEEVVRAAALRSLAEWDLGGLTPERLEEMRRPRFPPDGSVVASPPRDD